MQKVLEPNQRVKGTIHKVYATSCEYPGKERTIAWKKYNVKVPHQRSPYAMKFEDQVP